MEELLCHLCGDFLLQNSWMANKKYSHWIPVTIHGIVYLLPFLVLGPSWNALLIMGISHILIDHYRLASVVPRVYNWDWEGWKWYGWLDERSWNASVQPAPLPESVLWVPIAIDQFLHLLINHLALGL